MTTQNPSTMTAAFFIACLTPATSVPTRAYLTTIQAELNSDAMNIASTTSPTYGHLVLTVTPATYVGYGANAFPAPINPGLNPTIIAVNPTASQIAETNCQHLLLCSTMTPIMLPTNHSVNFYSTEFPAYI